ncbi:hypothetical protein PQO03_19160 [Lentisphaera profundi]|uniref:CHAD domain-containing protein n=1 Tax=Lentisphaera profundi TaxID=1658616 RepID=A0ABY7VXE2_9BACT|nr:hypothetical protein [Lentisphaera profundi]WDE97949.1 hypothetical protein PQO03_19160 [Lentisphaera profundi]
MKKQLTIALTLLLGTTAFSQQTASTARITQLEQQFTASQAKVQRLVSHLKIVDGKIEQEITSMVTMLNKFKDSHDSKSRVLGNKEKLIKDLRASIKFYSDQRKKIANDLKLTTKRFRAEDMQKLLAFLDKKMLTRLDQIVAITKHLGEYKEIYDISDRFRRDRNNTRDADKTRNKLIKDINTGITNLETERTKLDKYFDNPNPTKELSQISHEISAIDMKIKVLQNSIAEIMYGGKDGQKVSRDKARTINDLVRTQNNKLSANLQTMNRGLNQLYMLLQSTKRASDALAKAEGSTSAKLPQTPLPKTEQTPSKQDIKVQ